MTFSRVFLFLFLSLGGVYWNNLCCCTLLIRVHKFSDSYSHIHCKEEEGKGEIKLPPASGNVGSIETIVLDELKQIFLVYIQTTKAAVRVTTTR